MRIDKYGTIETTKEIDICKHSVQYKKCGKYKSKVGIWYNVNLKDNEYYSKKSK